MSDERSDPRDQREEEIVARRSRPLLSPARHGRLWAALAAIVAVLTAIWRCA